MGAAAVRAGATLRTIAATVRRRFRQPTVPTAAGASAGRASGQRHGSRRPGSAIHRRGLLHHLCRRAGIGDIARTVAENSVQLFFPHLT